VLSLPNSIEQGTQKQSGHDIIHAAVVIPAKVPLYQMIKTGAEATANILEAAEAICNLCATEYGVEVIS